MTLATPPLVSGGLPVIGHALEMLQDREGLFKRGYQEHGELFAIKLGPQFALVVTGAEYNRLVYTETDKSLNMQDGYTSVRAAFGDILFLASKEKYYTQRPAIQEIFKRERMLGYIQAMNIEVQRWLDSLGQSGETNITEDMLHLTQYVAGRAFIGADFEKELGSEFWKDYADISASLDFVLPPNLPLPKFLRRDRAKKRISETIGTAIQKRREHPERYDDLITTLLSTPMKDNSIMSNEDIVSTFMGLIFAGHETTAGQAAWTIALLLQNPDYLELVQKEISEQISYGQEIDAHKLSQINHIYWAIDETTRMRPSADLQLRTVDEAIQVGDYEIPAGWRVMVNSANSHFKADVFENPDEFDPMRFSAERGEGKNPFAIIGFGGGIHKCTGMNFAKNEMAIITSLLFQQFELELLSDEIHVMSGKGANHPSELRVRYRRKPLAELTDGETIREAVEAGCPHIKQQVATEQH